jgi:transposase
LEVIKDIDSEKLYHFDESGIDLEINSEYGFCQQGKRLEIPRSGKRGKRLNILAARDSNNNLLFSKIYESTIDKDIFKNYLKEDLFPYIPKGSYLRLDKAKFHHDSKAEIADKSIETIADIAEEFDITLLYLPAYSPDLNPIEKKWAQLKYWYRKLRGKHKLKRELLESLLGIDKNASLI